MGFGPVAPEEHEPVFHAAWEKRAMALTLAAGAMGHWSVDESRQSRETRHPSDYYGSSYYELWVKGLERLLLQHGFVTEAELAAGRAADPAPVPRRVLDAEGALLLIHRGVPYDRLVATPPRFAIGARVRTLNLNPVGHTRLPRYARGKLGMAPMAASCSPTAMRRARAKSRSTFIPLLLRRRSFGGAMPTRRPRSALTPGRAILSRPEPPLDAGDRVFAEPWQAQAFALTLTLHQNGLFTWSDWSKALSAELKRTDAAADGSDYYDRWLVALETLLVTEGVVETEALNALTLAWQRAAHATPHGKPIVLENDPHFGTTPPEAGLAELQR